MDNVQQENQQPKLPKERVFKTVQKNFAKAGIGPELAAQSYPFNGKIIFGYLILIAALISACVHVLYYAKTFVEYTQSIYMGSIAIIAISSMLATIFKVKNLFEIINRCDIILNMSRWPKRTGRISFC